MRTALLAEDSGKEVTDAMEEAALGGLLCLWRWAAGELTPARDADRLAADAAAGCAALAASAAAGAEWGGARRRGGGGEEARLEDSLRYM